MVKSTMYLYGIDPIILTDMPYKQALMYKISSAESLLAELLIPHHTIREHERITHIYKAIKFNQHLLKELLC